ncbi:DNA polymerase domain-containing protein [Halorubrum ezzemoulense]|uniref:DNA polymerase domain-containing protein n=1 Tax=Halorubrum ezzemoulense TaxID=337243 RepID=UPI00233150A4|nr:DNA polymerase domain-containing protein [Halorubrum ezzemoulense]MDB9247430.1 DNA polymerase domain-containing protein [Halorubrum ezzemoulense]MDB9258661.1 DNA polymerase domain-containing protein [Halorubrum ezzemoulense]MDB9264481.1 DNA polymerase domain-containing protein [Halorubrum ezzemoulense]MDB9269022.1 DNA polymerase domain-containing protein [Halorubrum ezzemoulense]MDB9271449.1 DNA polymerase domain-containing protein [Halorubrum ezzemoulense]
MSLYTGLQDLSGARYTEANHVGDVIDLDILRAAQDRGEALPTAGDPERDKYHGAVVFDPVAGVHRNVSYPDYSSLYPNVMRDVNASPETIVGVGDAVLARSEYSRSELRWSYIDPRPVKQLEPDELFRDFTDGTYKMVYDPQSNTIKWRDDWERVQEHLEPIYFLAPDVREGTLPSRADTYIRWNKSYEGTMYKATKRQRNGLYGVSGDSNFRLFDWRVAEAITIGGRMLLEYGAETIIERLSSTFESDAVYITHGDTDGFGVAVDQDVSRGHVLSRVRKTVEWLNETGMPQFVEETFGVPADETAHAVDLESYSPKLFIPADDGSAHTQEGTKKTYAERVTWDEGDECDEVEITGFEAKRSDIADITEAVQTDVLEAILYQEPLNAKDAVYERIRTAVERVKSGDADLSELGKRSGMGKPPEEYGDSNRSAHPTYRGAKYAKQHIDGEERFDKPMKFPVERIHDPYPSTYDTDTAEDGDPVDYISVEEPSNIPDAIDIDREQIIVDTLKQPLDPILGTMGWGWGEAIHGHEQTGLDAYAQA